MYSFTITLNLDDPSLNSYYYPILICIGIILVIIELIIGRLGHKGSISMSIQKPNESSNQSYSYANNTLPSQMLEKNPELKTLKESLHELKFKYLVAYTLTRSAMWAKAPYLYTLFMTVHKFSMKEIGILYLVDAVAALIFGPITGQLSDVYGRKLFCHVYNFSIVVNLLLRMEGGRITAYTAQIVTGLGAGLINTAFEAWVVTACNLLVGEYKIENKDGDKDEKKEFNDANKQYNEELDKIGDRFMKKLFRVANSYDAVISIIVSAINAIIYSYFGIFAPLFISIGLTIIASIAVCTWKENYAENKLNKSAMKLFIDSWGELKKTTVLCIGLIEGIIMAVLNIFLFSWTPILKQSTEGNMNVGFIFTCMILTMFLGTKVYELVIIKLEVGNYKGISASILFEGTLFILVFFINSFRTRLILLAMINGFQGFYNPLNSIIKKKILSEEYRATLMNIFRIPLNFYVIVVLLTLRYMNPFHVALIAGCMTFVAFIISIVVLINEGLIQRKKQEPNKNVYRLAKSDDEIVS